MLSKLKIGSRLLMLIADPDDSRGCYWPDIDYWCKLCGTDTNH